mgnify:CR=1 FL=1
MIIDSHYQYLNNLEIKMNQLIGELYPTRKAMKADYRRFDIRVSILIGADKVYEREIYASSRAEARAKCAAQNIKPWNF